MNEQGMDRYGAEYKRSDNDFHVRYLEQDNCVCSVCHGTGAKLEIRYITRDYQNGRTKKICENLQSHEHSLWICPKCVSTFNRKKSAVTMGKTEAYCYEYQSTDLWNQAKAELKEVIT